MIGTAATEAIVGRVIETGPRPAAARPRAHRAPHPGPGGARPTAPTVRRGPTAPARPARPERAPKPEREAPPKPKRLSPANVHRAAVLDALPPEQRPIAEQVLRGGIPAVRQAVEQQNASLREQGGTEVKAERAHRHRRGPAAQAEGR